MADILHLLFVLFVCAPAYLIGAIITLFSSDESDAARLAAINEKIEEDLE